MSCYRVRVSDADDGVIVFPVRASGKPVSVEGWTVQFLLSPEQTDQAPVQQVEAWATGDQVLVDTTGSVSWPQPASWELVLTAPWGGRQRPGYGELQRSQRQMSPGPPRIAGCRPAAPGDVLTVSRPSRGAPPTEPPADVTELLDEGAGGAAEDSTPVEAAAGPSAVDALRSRIHARRAARSDTPPNAEADVFPQSLVRDGRRGGQ